VRTLPDVQADVLLVHARSSALITICHPDEDVDGRALHIPAPSSPDVSAGKKVAEKAAEMVVKQRHLSTDLHLTSSIIFKPSLIL
jgi:hypothetical protein